MRNPTSKSMRVERDIKNKREKIVTEGMLVQKEEYEDRQNNDDAFADGSYNHHTMVCVYTSHTYTYTHICIYVYIHIPFS